MSVSRRVFLGISAHCGVLACAAAAIGDSLPKPGAYRPHCVAFSPDSKTLAVGDPNGVDLWDLATKKLTASVPCDQTVFSVAFSPDGELIAAGTGLVSRRPEPRTGTENVIMWDARTRRQLAKVDCEEETLISVAFTPDSKQLVAGGQRLAVYSARTLKLLGKLESASAPFALVSQGKQIVAREVSGSLIIIELATDNEVQRIKGGVMYDWFSRRELAATPDGKLIAKSTGQDVSVIETATGKTREVSKPVEKDIGALSFSPDGTALAIASKYDQLVLWDIEHGRAAKNYHVRGPAILDVAFSPDGKRLALVNAYYVSEGPNDFGGFVEFWDLEPAAGR